MVDIILNNILKLYIDKIMNYEDKKIVGIIVSNVEPSVALNVIGHLFFFSAACHINDVFPNFFTSFPVMFHL